MITIKINVAINHELSQVTTTKRYLLFGVCVFKITAIKEGENTLSVFAQTV